LAVAKEASANASADIQSSSENTRNNTLILGNMMKSLLDTVVGKLKAAWDGICAAVLAIYDVFVDIVNWIGEGISKLWDGFATWIENFINGLAEKIVNFLEDIGVDVDEWEGIELGRSNFESLKSVDEMEAEGAAKKAEEDLIAAT
jgi:phage-related protein